MLLLDDLCNRSPGFGALVILEETPSPLPVGGPTDGLLKLTRQNCVIVDPGYRLLHLLSAAGGFALLGGPFHLGIPHHACMDTPIPEVHPPGDPRLDLPGPVDAQCLREDDVGKYKGSLGVPAPFNYPLPFHSQDGCGAAPYCS